MFDTIDSDNRSTSRDICNEDEVHKQEEMPEEDEEEEGQNQEEEPAEA